MTLFELQKQFPTELSVIEHFIQVRYSGEPKCHICDSVDVYHRKDTPKRFQCRGCKNSFSIFKNTIFENTSTSLLKWMYAINLLLNGKKGISGLQLQREIGGGYKTCWRMLKQIRLAMEEKTENFENYFEYEVEMDETYVGGKPRKNGKGKNVDKNVKRGRGTNKTPVVGILDRVKKRVYAQVALPNKDGKKVTGKQLKIIFDKVVKRENVILFTDEFRGYNIFNKTQHIHLVIDHSKEYVNKEGIHTNNIESFWATLKRGVYGIYHHISPKYLQQYVNEFCFRYNNRRNPATFVTFLENSILKI